ncbi:MAG: tetratricopeptide repeat protein, partial [Clostridia bacterium]|nr:tetratricopeptide repeat protein [Clostridia bacterium]
MKKILSLILAGLLAFSVLPVLAEGEATAPVVEETPAVPVEAPAVPVQETPAMPADGSSMLDVCYTLAINAISAENYESAKDYIGVCFGYCDPQTNPTMYADLLLKLACINVIEQKYDIAQLNLNAVLRIDPDMTDAYLVRVEAYAAQGNVDRTIENLEKYIELTQDASWYETLAQLYETKGDTAAAQEAYDKFIAGAEQTEEAVFQAALYRKQAEKFEEAIAMFETLADSEVYGAGSM